MEVGKVIYNILSNDGTVSGITNRIKPLLFQDPALTTASTVTPSIIYEVSNTSPTDVKGQTSPVDVFQVLITALEDDYNKSVVLSSAIRSALDQYSGTNSGLDVDSIYFIDSDDNFIQNTHEGQSGIFVVEQLYRIRIKNS
jgi:hypothetical protein